MTQTVGVLLPVATDWNEVTAIATALLALLTAILVVAAIIAAKRAREAIEAQLNTAKNDLEATQAATQAAQTMAQQQIEAERRPLLIEVAPDTPMPEGDGKSLIRIVFPDNPQSLYPRQVYVYIQAGFAYVTLPLRNVGQGLAVVEPSDVWLSGDGVGKMFWCEVWRGRVPPGETTRIICTTRYARSKSTWPPHILELLVPYRDLVGGQLTTAVIRLEQPMDAKKDWAITKIKQTTPDKIALPSGVGPPLPQK